MNSLNNEDNKHCTGIFHTSVNNRRTDTPTFFQPVGMFSSSFETVSASGSSFREAGLPARDRRRELVTDTRSGS